MTQKAKRGRFLLLIIAAIAIFGWQLFSTFGDGDISDKDKLELKTSGMKCQAILRSVERTGSTVNNIHQYEFSFDVKPDSGDMFTYQEKKLIDPIYMASIKVGMAVPAYVMPDDHDKVWIVWEEVGIKDAF